MPTLHFSMITHLDVCPRQLNPVAEQIKDTAAPCPRIQPVARLSMCSQGTCTVHSLPARQINRERSALPVPSLIHTAQRSEDCQWYADIHTHVPRCPWTLRSFITDSRSPVLLSCWHTGLKVPKFHSPTALLVLGSLLIIHTDTINLNSNWSEPVVYPVDLW